MIENTAKATTKRVFAEKSEIAVTERTEITEKTANEIAATEDAEKL